MSILKPIDALQVSVDGESSKRSIYIEWVKINEGQAPISA